MRNIFIDSMTFQTHLINSVITEGKQLRDDLIGVCAKSIVVHRVGDEMLAILDRSGSLPGEIEMDIHVVDVCRRVHRYFVPCQLLLVVEGWPVVGSRDNLSHFLELTEFWRSFERVLENLQHSSADYTRIISSSSTWPYHFTREEDTVLVRCATESFELGLQLISCPGRRFSVKFSVLHP